MKTLLLLVELLEENEIPPEKLHKVLEKCILMLKQYLNSTEIEKHESELIIGQELEDLIKPFAHFLEYSIIIKKQQ